MKMRLDLFCVEMVISPNETEVAIVHLFVVISRFAVVCV